MNTAIPLHRGNGRGVYGIQQIAARAIHLRREVDKASSVDNTR
ncbi:MAG: hypothetical protein ABGZ35_07400 [Planctomycetaceae bacterium]